MELKSFIESRGVGKIVFVISILAIAFAIFQAGIFVGFHKASFLFNYNDNYYRNFGGQNNRPGFGGSFGGRMMMDKGGYGITGKIIKIDSDKIFVLGTDNIEKIITVSSTTKVFERRDEIKLSDLKIDQNIVTIGNPDSMGQINAKLIRIMPFINNK
jgi:hypothetical protein